MRRTTMAVALLALPWVAITPCGSAAAVTSASAATCSVVGSPGDDVLLGTPGPDVICGLAGHDVLRGLGGDDVLLGGSGDDMLVGRAGNDRLFGGAGHDSLVPGIGDDAVDGGSDRDNVSYRDLAGGVVIDLVAGTAGGTAPGSDVLGSIEGMTGTPGDDTMIGTADRNYIEALGGDDVIRPGDGPDLVNGSAGVDLLDYTGLDHGVYVNLRSGMTYHGGRIRGIEDITGTEFTDVFEGDSGPNTFIGAGERDGLYGGGGDDVLEGGPGDEYFLPGDGNDMVAGGPGRDVVAFPNEGVPVDVDLDLGTVARDGVAEPFTSVEEVSGTWGDDRLRGGRGATDVTFYGNGGVDTIDTVDGLGGDKIHAVNLGPLPACTGDPGDDIECRSVS